jgi:hypothetical protein
MRQRRKVGNRYRRKPTMDRHPMILRLAAVALAMVMVVLLVAVDGQTTTEDIDTIGQYVEPISTDIDDKKEKRDTRQAQQEPPPLEVDGHTDNPQLNHKPNNQMLETEEIAAEIFLEQKVTSRPQEQPQVAEQQQLNGLTYHPLDKDVPTSHQLPEAAGKSQEHEDFGDEEIGESAAKDQDEETNVDENPKDYYFYAFDEKSVVIEQPRYEGDPDFAPFIWDPAPGEIRIVEFYAHWYDLEANSFVLTGIWAFGA